MGSKGAVVGLTRSLAFEAGAGITANVVMPGFSATDAARTADKALREFKEKSIFKDHVEGQCVKRGGQPDDLGHTICFIAGPEASFNTGQDFDVSGGVHLSLILTQQKKKYTPFCICKSFTLCLVRQ